MKRRRFPNRENLPRRVVYSLGRLSILAQFMCPPQNSSQSTAATLLAAHKWPRFSCRRVERRHERMWGYRVEGTDTPDAATVYVRVRIRRRQNNDPRPN